MIQECLILLFSTIFTQDSNDIARGQRVDFRFDLVEKSGEVYSSVLPTYVVASALLGSSPSFEYSSRLRGHSFFKESVYFKESTFWLNPSSEKEALRRSIWK